MQRMQSRRSYVETTVKCNFILSMNRANCSQTESNINRLLRRKHGSISTSSKFSISILNTCLLSISILNDSTYPKRMSFLHQSFARLSFPYTIVFGASSTIQVAIKQFHVTTTTDLTTVELVHAMQIYKNRYIIFFKRKFRKNRYIVV